MTSIEESLGDLVARLVKQCVREGHSVELDGLGVFLPSAGDGLEFVAETGPRVFISYVNEDAGAALEIADALAAAGMKPWVDRRKLLPGQAWRKCIERAIERSDFFLACFSRQAARKRGQFPCELRHALRCGERLPLDDLFIIPVRLEECEVPQRITSQIQYVDLFPDRRQGLRRIEESIHREYAARKLRDAA